MEAAPLPSVNHQRELAIETQRHKEMKKYKFG
jgi:hypothetical protein